MEAKLVRASAGYTVFGLLGGVYYRELTRSRRFPRAEPTQLRVFHTHCLSLGTLFLLLVLILEKLYQLSAHPSFKKFYGMYNAGLGITLMLMLVKGTLTVIGKDVETSRLLAWSAGVGHTLLGVAFFFFYKALMASVKGNDKK